MKKITMINVIVALMVIGVIQILSFASISLAEEGIWDSCNRGMVDCEYPGLCRSYIDTNNDHMCDRSQLPPQQDMLSEELNTVVNNTTNNRIDTISGGTVLGGDIPNTPPYINEDTKDEKHRSLYNLLPILVVSTLLYLLTWILSKKKIINQRLHRKIWNILLLISTLVSAVLGLVLILNLEYNTAISLPFNMLFWHVEAGLVMGFIALFHILWHWRYFKKILKIEENRYGKK